jgi:hypothetical protein
MRTSLTDTSVEHDRHCHWCPTRAGTPPPPSHHRRDEDRYHIYPSTRDHPTPLRARRRLNKRCASNALTIAKAAAAPMIQPRFADGRLSMVTIRVVSPTGLLATRTTADGFSPVILTLSALSTCPRTSLNTLRLEPTSSASPSAFAAITIRDTVRESTIRTLIGTVTVSPVVPGTPEGASMRSGCGTRYPTNAHPKGLALQSYYVHPAFECGECRKVRASHFHRLPGTELACDLSLKEV